MSTDAVLKLLEVHANDPRRYILSVELMHYDEKKRTEAILKIHGNFAWVWRLPFRVIASGG